MGKVFDADLVKTGNGTGINADEWVDLRKSFRAKLENRYKTYENMVNTMSQLAVLDSDPSTARRVKSLVTVMKEFNARIYEFKINMRTFLNTAKQALLLGVVTSEANALSKAFTLACEEDMFAFIEAKDQLLLEFDLLSHPHLSALLLDNLEDDNTDDLGFSLSISDLDQSSNADADHLVSEDTLDPAEQGGRMSHSEISTVTITPAAQEQSFGRFKLFKNPDERRPNYVGGEHFGMKKKN